MSDTPAASVIFRPMKGTDIESVSKIERQSFSSAWNTQAYVTELANPSALYIVAWEPEAEQVVGYGGLWVIMDEAHITTLAVIPERRGQKIGEQLLAELLVASQKQGATRATLEVRERNTAARKLYEKYGFEWAAVRKKYYADNNEDAHILWINDMTTPAWQAQFAQNRAALSRIFDADNAGLV